jgi:hypothetical protein
VQRGLLVVVENAMGWQGNFVGFFDLILMHVAIVVTWMVGYLGILMGLEFGFEVNYGYTLVVIFG